MCPWFLAEFRCVFLCRNLHRKKPPKLSSDVSDITSFSFSFICKQGVFSFICKQGETSEEDGDAELDDGSNTSMNSQHDANKFYILLQKTQGGGETSEEDGDAELDDGLEDAEDGIGDDMVAGA